MHHQPVWLSGKAASAEDWVINLDAGRSMLMVRLRVKCFLHPIMHIRFLLVLLHMLFLHQVVLTHLARSLDCMWFWILLPLASCHVLNQSRKDMSSLFTQKCKYYLKGFSLSLFFFCNKLCLKLCFFYRSIKRIVSYFHPRPGVLMSLIYESSEFFMSRCHFIAHALRKCSTAAEWIMIVRLNRFMMVLLLKGALFKTKKKFNNEIKLMAKWFGLKYYDKSVCFIIRKFTPFYFKLFISLK